MADPSALAAHTPPLGPHEARVEANRCLFCFDAPCTLACPTHIDIPRFIKKIATGNQRGAARTIFDANLLGATCARVCPVEELCEGACVLGAEHKPIRIGRLQRFAIEQGTAGGAGWITRAPATGKRVAVVGAGPAGLSCAGELARRGHAVTLYEKQPLPGGLSTYGIITLREPLEASLAEVEMIRGLGVTMQTGVALGRDLTLDQLRREHHAVFLGLGLGGSPALGIPGEEHIADGLEFIAASKLRPAELAVGRDVLVVGAGNTAIDCATIAKRLGAASVTIVYRRTEREMTAYPHEYEFIKREGVEFRFLTQPVRVLTSHGSITGLACQRMQLGAADASGRPAAVPAAGAELVLLADQIIKAIGQQKPPFAAQLGLATQNGFIQVNQEGETSLPGVFSGGDCIRVQGAASTVMAVEDGKRAAQAIHRRLTTGEN